MWNIDYWLECKISVEKAFHAWSSEGCVISSEVLNKSILNLLFTQVTVPFLLSPSYLLFLHPYFLLFPLSSSSCPFSFSPSFSSHTCIIIFYPIMYLYFFLSFISSIHPVTLSFFFHSTIHPTVCPSIHPSIHPFFLPPIYPLICSFLASLTPDRALVTWTVWA